MSELNYLEKLLDGTEVEWKALGDVTSVLRGKRLTKNLLSAEEKFPVFHGGLEPLGYYNKSNRPANTVMIINVGASAGTVGYSTVDFWSSDGCFCLEHNELLNNRFLYFALIGYQSLLKSKVRVAGIPTLDAIVVNKLLIPIPCPENPEKSLAIQSAIVRILDKFTALTAELTAELNIRKKQYNYYRDQLLCFDEAEVEWKTLADVAILRRGRVMSKGYLEQNAGDYPVYSSQTARNGMIGSIDTYDFDGEFISWTTDGANAGTVFYRTGKFSITNVCGLIKIHENYPISYKYLYYWLSIEAQKHVYSGMGNPKLMSHQVEKITVPIPFPASPEKSMLEQQRIVGILDKLEAITFSLTEGLPREIELRQKQYEYYRDLLFSFPKPDSVTN